MKTYINIKNKRLALSLLYQLKEKRNNSLIIRFDNVELTKLNKYVKHQLFKRKNLYVDAKTLYELMQPVGGKGAHNYHGLTPELIINSLKNIDKPYCIFEDGIQKYAIITSKQNNSGDYIMIVIAIEMNLLINNVDNINKFVTMFPKKNIDAYLKNMPQEHILYKRAFK